MTTFGFHASHEQHSPRNLLALVQEAERAGFQHGMCSDHFHPWSARQGQSGFAWSWLGAALEATNLSFGTVCAPGQRYHPAIVAQAAVTLAQMYPDRFWLAIGSGEALNESITSDPWPPKAERNARLKESADVMRALWAGETVSHRGHVQIHRAKLYTRTESPPMLLGAAMTAETASWIGGWADGMITAGSRHEDLKKVCSAFRENGGESKPIYLQTAICLGATRDEALHICHDQWRHAALKLAQLTDLPTPGAFDEATIDISAAELATRLRVSDSFDELWEGLQKDAALGINRIYVHHIGRDMTRFFEHCRSVIR